MMFTRKVSTSATATTSRSSVRPSLHVRNAVHRVQIPRAGKQEGGVMDRPDTEKEVDPSKQAGWDNEKDIDLLDGPETESGDGNNNEDRLKGNPRGGGDFRVLLLKSDKHTEKGVVKAICSTIPSTNEAHAKNCYQTSKSLGMAIICSVPKEHAEHYSMQLYRQGCKCKIEPDTAAQ